MCSDRIEEGYKTEKIIEVEAGPFQLHKFESDEQARSFEIEGDDEEHSIYGDNSGQENPPLEEIYQVLNSLENDAGETRENAWERMLEIIDMYEQSKNSDEPVALPMVSLKSSYLLNDE